MFRRLLVMGLIGISAFSMKANTPNKPLTLKDTIKDASIQIPTELDRNLDQLLVDWKNSYHKPADCEQYSMGEIIFPDSVYIDRLYNYPSEMELAYNQIVRSYIDMYATRRSKSVQYMLSKGKYYFPFIEETLDRHGLPLELKYLPVIESALNPIAVSRAGATGLWQFMLRTGKMYDLEVNSLVDERRDPMKATEAAARYLKDLYDIYGDWNLVIAAYNCGPGNVNKAIRRSDGKTDYWAIYNYLPRETRGYVPAFIAATYIMNYYAEHNICPMDDIHPVSVDTLQIDNNLHFKQISEVLNIPLEEIRELNPQYKKDIIPGGDKKYSLCLPSPAIAEFISKQDDIFNHNTQQLLAHRKTVQVEGTGTGATSSTGRATKTHKIKSGESLGTIAKKYGVTVAHLKRMNNLSSNDIRAGKTLVIRRAAAPVATKNIAPASTPSPKPAEKPEQLASVEPSEKAITSDKIQPPTEQAELPSINKVERVAVNTESDGFFAKYYKSQKTQAQPAVNNHLADNKTVKAEMPKDSVVNQPNLTNTSGYHLASSSKQNADEENIIYHKVKIGETLSVIARRYDVSAIEIIQWNNLPAKRAKIGQELKIKLPAKSDLVNEELVMEIEGENNGMTEIQNVQPTTNNKQQVAQKAKTTYRVRKGDSLYIIAQRFGKVTAQDIMLVNNLKSDKLSVGQVLKIPVN